MRSPRAATTSASNLRPFVFVLALAVAGLGHAAPVGRGPSLGVSLDPSRTATLPAVDAGLEGASPWVRVEAVWRDVELEPGVYDWSAVSPAIARAGEAGYRVALALAGPGPDGADLPDPGEPLEAWLRFVRGAARSFGGEVEVFEVWPAEPRAAPPADADAVALYAFMLKQSSIALRAEASAAGFELRVAQGAIPAPAAFARQRELWAAEVSPYVDVLPLTVGPDDDPKAAAEALRPFVIESLNHPPAPAMWIHVERGAREWDAASTAVAALAAGAEAALIELAGGATDEAAWVNGMQGLLARGYEPAPLGGLELEYPPDRSTAGAAVLGRFFLAEDFSTLVVYRAPQTQQQDTPRLIVDAPVVRNVRLIDPVGGDVRRTAASARSGGRPGRALRLDAGPVPRAALFQKQVVTEGLELPPEEVDVASTRGLTAEEIIARYQEIQREQDDRLERWTAKGRVDFHFKLAQGTATVDFSIESNYFWERGGELEWEQTDYYINGNRIGWKNIPELPLIQPEKVITLPLDLTLDRTYSYRLSGRERVAGREAYVLEFAPSEPDPERSLYRGRVWIDSGNFARVKASVLQTQTIPPVLSNEEVDRFEPLTAPDGETYWMFSEIKGQQIWNAAGRSFVVRRELTFSDFEINPVRDDFENRRSEAYASSNQMLRDTDQGFRYLERQDDGSRVVKQTEDTSQLFAAGGAFKDSSQDNVLPLAGVNYFNYNLGGKNIQVNALFAGVLGFFTASKPDLAGGRLDLTLDAGLSAIMGEDKVFRGDDEVEAEQVESRAQNVTLRLGVPMGKFSKLSLSAGLRFRDYSKADDSDDAIEAFNAANPEQLEFVLPEDHTELSGTLDFSFNRKGYSLSASGRWARRSEWESWGLRDTVSGSFGSLGPGGFTPGEPEPEEDSFSRWAATVGKEWYLPKFQKLRLSADYLGGSNLDRFSRYQFSFFGDDRLNGFSGSGVRFDDGVIVRGGYAFNLLDVIRFDLALDSGRVEDERSGEGRQSFSGVGFSANFVGPWKTVINAGYGRALSSDISDLEGEDEFLLLILKLF